MNRLVKWAGLFLPLFLLLTGLLPLSPPSLLVSSQGHVLGEYPVTGTQFEVSFRHSINKGVVREVYRIDPRAQTVSLERGYFESYGAGMLDTVPPGVQLSFDETYQILDFPPAPQPEITYMAGTVAKHVFAYGDFSLALYELAPGKPVRFTVRRANLFQRLLGLAYSNLPNN